MMTVIIEAINGARMKGLTPIGILIGIETMERLFSEIPMMNRSAKQTIEEYKLSNMYGTFLGLRIERSDMFDFGFVIVTNEDRRRYHAISMQKSELRKVV